MIDRIDPPPEEGVPESERAVKLIEQWKTLAVRAQPSIASEVWQQDFRDLLKRSGSA